MVNVEYSENKKPTDLNNLAKFLNAHPNIKIVRHSDSRGSAAMNLTLSQKQAEAAKFYLKNKKTSKPKLNYSYWKR